MLARTTKTRPVGDIERALVWAGCGARREHHTRMIAPNLHLENRKLAVLDEKSRPMGIKGRGQSGIRRFRIKRPWGDRINGLESRKLKLSRWNKLKVVERVLGGRFLNRSLQFLFGLMVEFLVPSFRFSSLLPKFISAAYNFNSGGPCHSSFLSLLRDGVARNNLHNLYASYGRWAMQL
jgi:hypothetical protein